MKNYFFHEKYKTETVENEKNKYDIGLLELEKDLLEEYGYLGIDSKEENVKEGEEVEICGYPKYEKDEPKMWTASGEAKEVEESFIKSQIATSVGQSGSPMIKRIDGE